MYHLKDDKRVHKSAEMIVEGLSKCIKETPFEEINVCDIANSAGVSRATFYRIFDTPSDVLAYMCDKLAGDTVKLFYDNSFAQDQDLFGTYALKHWCGQTEVLMTIFKSGRGNLLQKSLEQSTSSFIDSFSALSKREFEYLRSTVIGVIYSILYVWIKNGKKESPEELIGIYKKIGAAIKQLKLSNSSQNNENI